MDSPGFSVHQVRTFVQTASMTIRHVTFQLILIWKLGIADEARKLGLAQVGRLVSCHWPRDVLATVGTIWTLVPDNYLWTYPGSDDQRDSCNIWDDKWWSKPAAASRWCLMLKELVPPWSSILAGRDTFEGMRIVGVEDSHVPRQVGLWLGKLADFAQNFSLWEFFLEGSRRNEVILEQLRRFSVSLVFWEDRSRRSNIMGILGMGSRWKENSETTFETRLLRIEDGRNLVRNCDGQLVEMGENAFKQGGNDRQINKVHCIVCSALTVAKLKGKSKHLQKWMFMRHWKINLQLRHTKSRKVQSLWSTTWKWGNCCTIT